jgi:hypothetical protein
MHDWQWICADDTHAIAPWQQAGALAFAPAGLRDALQDLDEIKEALVQITVYCGTPAGRQAFLAAHEALKSPKDSTRPLTNRYFSYVRF